MPNQKNIESMAAINTKLDQALSLVVADYSGLKLSAQTQLRAQIKAAGGEMMVAKNRLVMRALTEKLKDLGGLPRGLEEALRGPNAVIYGFTDAVAAVKVLVDFAKKDENLEVKVGLMMGEAGAPASVLSQDQVKALAALPGKPQLLAQLVGTLNAPLTGLVNVLSGPTRSLVYVLTAIKDSKSTN